MVNKTPDVEAVRGDTDGSGPVSTGSFRGAH